jgi:hypothetical protein
MDPESQWFVLEEKIWFINLWSSVACPLHVRRIFLLCVKAIWQSRQRLWVGIGRCLVGLIIEAQAFLFAPLVVTVIRIWPQEYWTMLAEFETIDIKLMD